MGTSKQLSTLLLALILPSGHAISEYLNCPCKVSNVIDGNSVQLLDQSNKKLEVSLSGIDAPELKQAFGKKSGKNLSKLIAGMNIKVEYNRRDRNGRIMGKLIVDGQDINLLQVRQGYAWHDQYHQKDQSGLDSILYSSAENEARKKTIGLWAYPAIPPWEFRKKH